MSERTSVVCEHCGQPVDSEGELEHRACRLKAAFPGAYHQDGALVSFDMEAIRKAIGWNERVGTRAGLSFERSRGGDIWVSLETKVGNVLSSWSWKVTDVEWDQIVSGMSPVTP